MRNPKEWTCSLLWTDPSFVNPPFNRPILAIIGSMVDRGRGFKSHYEVITIKVLKEDVDGNGAEGKQMAAELETDKTKWDDFQFRVVTTTLDDEQDFYSDSIAWWCEKPSIPDSTPS